jgi:hypothetical protein
MISSTINQYISKNKSVTNTFVHVYSSNLDFNVNILENDLVIGNAIQWSNYNLFG